MLFVWNSILHYSTRFYIHFIGTNLLTSYKTRLNSCSSFNSSTLYITYATQETQEKHDVCCVSFPPRKDFDKFEGALGQTHVRNIQHCIYCKIYFKGMTANRIFISWREYLSVIKTLEQGIGVAIWLTYICLHINSFLREIAFHQSSPSSFLITLQITNRTNWHLY